MNTGGPNLSCSLAWLYLYDGAGNEVANGQAKSPLDGFFDFITLPLAQWTPLDATIEGEPEWANYRVNLSSCEEYPGAGDSRLFTMADTQLEPFSGRLLRATANMINVSGDPCDWVTYYAILYDQEGQLVSINHCGYETDVPLKPYPVECLVHTEPEVEPRIEWIVQGRWYTAEDSLLP